jgi:hypothetical protein
MLPIFLDKGVLTSPQYAWNNPEEMNMKEQFNPNNLSLSDSISQCPESISQNEFNLSLSHAKTTAIAAGDLRAVVFQEVTNILAASRGNPPHQLGLPTTLRFVGSRLCMSLCG